MALESKVFVYLFAKNARLLSLVNQLTTSETLAVAMGDAGGSYGFLHNLLSKD